jgi:integrase
MMVNRYLKQVGKMVGIDTLTTYDARYTWANIAAGLDIPKETIAQALGHTKPTVTDVYITFDRNKVDKANRMVIDYILNIK